MADNKPRKPSKDTELNRIAHALWSWGYNHPASGTVYVVMSEVQPLHRVLGIFSDLTAAQSFLTGKKVSAYPPTDDQWKHIFIYEVELQKRATQRSQVRTLSADVCWHDCYTEYWCPQGSTITLDATFDHWELQAVDKNGNVLGSVSVGPEADLITISESASKDLLMNDLRTRLGQDYVAKLNERRKSSKLKDLKSNPAEPHD